MVPIVNSLAFLFTVFGDWLAVRKVIAWGMYNPPTICIIYLTPSETWAGIGLVCLGIGLCVDSKRERAN